METPKNRFDKCQSLWYNSNTAKKGKDKMITLTFETWEEFDQAIAGITKLEIDISMKGEN